MVAAPSAERPQTEGQSGPSCLAKGEVETSHKPDTKHFVERMNRLEMYALYKNPFGKCCYSLRACRGIAKALIMLFPNGRNGKSSSMPTKATIEKVKRFLKVKVKRHLNDNEMSTSLPTLQDLLIPSLFSVDLQVHSHLRIQGKEVLTPCVLPKLIWLAVSALNLKTSTNLTMNENNASLDQEEDLPKDSRGRYVTYIHESDIPQVAHWLMMYCIIPGGPWTVYGAVSAGLPAIEEKESNPQQFQKMQARLLQTDQKTRKTTPLPFVDTPKNVAFVYKEQS